VKGVVIRILSRNRDRQVPARYKSWGLSKAVRLRLSALMAYINNLDLSSAILLNTRCLQHTFIN
jgi:hypothetical protein